MKNQNPTAETAPKAKVLIVDDHPMFREHLSQLINREFGLEVCGEADNVQDAMILLKKLNPEVAIVDITLKGSSGLELLKDIKSQEMDVKVLVLSMHDEELYAERALRAGAKGYITKNEASVEVAHAIKRVLSGQIYASRRMMEKILERLSKKVPPEQTDVGRLADRELEVFQLLGKGKTTQDIAKMLNLGDSTVETYRSRIKEKLNLVSAAELYLRAGQWVRENGA